MRAARILMVGLFTLIAAAPAAAASGATVSANEPLALVLTGLGLVGASLLVRRRR